MTRALALALAALVGLAVAAPAQAQRLVADLSDHLIAVNTGFTGTEVVVFGTIRGEGDIAVVVRGPPKTITVHQKTRTLGIWMNTARASFEAVPTFYATATSGPVGAILDASEARRQGIGLDNLLLRPVFDDRARPAQELAPFQEALKRRKIVRDLYAAAPAPVTFLGDSLFRARLRFPANVPVGQYTVSVFLLRDGRVTDALVTPLAVSRIGASAEIFQFSAQRSEVYALLAVLFAVFAGWAAGALFRQG